MPYLFMAIGLDRGFPAKYGERISMLVPDTIRRLPCFLDKLTGIWRYEYGKPITLQRGATIVGTPMFPAVEQLFDVLGCAEWRLSAEELRVYLTRLSDAARHEDVLVEFAPILRLREDVTVRHEVSGNDDSGTTVDWRIESTSCPVLLLEVKNRILDLIESMEAIRHLERGGEATPPQHNHAMLFKDVKHKFKPAAKKRRSSVSG